MCKFIVKDIIIVNKIIFRYFIVFKMNRNKVSLSH